MGGRPHSACSLSLAAPYSSRHLVTSHRTRLAPCAATICRHASRPHVPIAHRRKIPAWYAEGPLSRAAPSTAGRVSPRNTEHRTPKTSCCVPRIAALKTMSPRSQVRTPIPHSTPILRYTVPKFPRFARREPPVPRSSHAQTKIYGPLFPHTRVHSATVGDVWRIPALGDPTPGQTSCPGGDGHHEPGRQGEGDECSNRG